MTDAKYRVIHRKRLLWTPKGLDDVDTYSIHEVVYSDDGLPVAYHRVPAAQYEALSLTQLRDMYNAWAAALGQPVLESWDFIGGGEDEHADGN